MTRTKKLMLGLLIAILCLTPIAAISIARNSVTSVTVNEDFLASDVCDLAVM